MIGQVLGHYRVDERIGAGGMGVVYRAYDTRLRRTVAIKVINAPGATSDAARGLLLAEARAASGLNHPHICTVHDVGEVDGLVFLVMEYVEGRPIDDLILDAGLPTETVSRHGANIAAALEHAHDHGILHRDLKAANVVVTTGGAAKVLDFGIAQRITSTGDGDPTHSATQPGVDAIAGTLAYLAPEVLTGGAASVQSDIWSLGVLLFEMATGARPFQGRSVFEMTGAILYESPSPMPAHVSPALRAVILRCLSKEAALRYARAGEVRAALETIGAGGEAADAVQVSPPRLSFRSVATVGVAVAAVGLLAVVWWLAPWAKAPDGPTREPGEGRLTLIVSSEQRIIDPALSPDGRMIAYIGEDQAGQRDLFVSQISGSGRIRLTDDVAVEGWPRFSPDGQRIAFMRQDAGIPSIYVTSALGGAMVRVVPSAGEPCWSPEGTRLAFVYRPTLSEPPALATSLADGSDVKVLFTAKQADPFIRNTAWSTDGRLIAFVLGSGGTAGDEVWTIPAAGGVARRLIDDPLGVFSAEPVFTPDGRQLVMSSNRGGATNLWSVPLSGGPPVQLTTGPGPDVSPTVAADGAVAFLNSRWRNALVVADFERGHSRTLLTQSPYLWAPTMSPDGSLVAFSRGETGGLWHIWTVPSQGGDARQLTFGDKGEIYPRFTADGSAVVYHTWGEPHRIWKALLAGGPPVALSADAGPDEAWADVSPDGRWLAFVRVEAGVERSYIAPINGGTARLLTSTPATTPRWSPDGTRLAFSHNRSYRGGISVIDADGRNERRLSETGGWPVWWSDGRSLAVLTVGGRGDQEVQRIDLAGKPLATGIWPRFIGTNQLFDLIRDGSSLVTALAVHQSDEIWLLRR